MLAVPVADAEQCSEIFPLMSVQVTGTHYRVAP
jgi:hypothetical protein